MDLAAASSSKDLAVASILGESHSLWLWYAESVGGRLLCPRDHLLSEPALATRGACGRYVEMIWETRPVEPAAEAKKAEGASCTALLIPRPPCLTERSLGPGWIWVLKGDVGDAAGDYPQQLIIGLELWEQETGGSPQRIRQFWNRKGVAE